MYSYYTTLGLVSPSAVVEVGGRKVGIIGYVTKETPVCNQHQ